MQFFLVLVALSALVLLAFNWRKIQRLLRVNALFKANNIVRNFSHMKDMFFHAEMAVKSASPTPLPETPKPLPDSFTFSGTKYRLEDWQTERCQTALVVLKNGQITHETYSLGTTEKDRRISWSMAKSILSAAFGVAHAEGMIPDLDSLVTGFVPEHAGSAYEGVTIRNVLNMASGIRFNEDYLDFHSDINKMGRVLALGKSMDGFAQAQTETARPPGSKRQYVSIDTHVLGMILRKATGMSAREYVGEKIMKPLGLEADTYYLTDGYGTDFVLGGLNMRTRDYARFGLMMAQNGRLNGTQIVPADWVAQSTCQSAPPPCEEDENTDNGLLGYGYQWWLPPDAANGEYFAIGIYGQYIYINFAEKVVIAVNSADRNFRDDDGRITLTNLEMFREISKSLNRA